MIAKIVLIAFAVWFLWKFFHNQTSLIAYFTFDVANSFLAFIFAILRFLFFGWMAYAAVAVYGNIGRISTIGDIFTLLFSRPSAVGGWGVIGVIVGIIFGLRAYHGVSYAPSASRGFAVQSVRTTTRPVVWFASFVYRVTRIRR